MPPELVWGLLPRFIGFLYVLGFGAMIPQHAVMPGIESYASIRERQERIRRDYPGIRRFFDFPTLFWLVASDRAQRAILVLGTVCGACAIYGGTLGYCALLAAWALWLSLEQRGTVFPWDTMLVEVGFLALFLPTIQALPNLHANALPLPSVAFVIRWLMLRLMIGFGKDKFIGIRRDDFLYLRGFFVWMPLPSPLGWYAHHAPRWMLKGMLGFMFFAEVIAPVLGLFAGPLRVVSFASLIMLMLGIQVTGNWGFFNLGYALLCVCLLDVNASIFDLAREPWASRLSAWPELAIHATMLVLFLVSLFYLLLNTWFTRSWVNWPPDMFPIPHKWQRLAKRIHRAFEPLRLIAPFRVVNGYGVFAPHSIAPVRILPVFEGSDDGVIWKQYGYRHQPSFATQRPPFISPYHARFDQFSYYITLGIDSSSIFGSLFPLAHPYGIHTRTHSLDLLVQRLLKHDPTLLRALGHNPFPDRPPKLVRVGIIGMTPTRPREMHKTGHWWHIRRFGELLPPRGLESWPNELMIPHPELFHPDLIDWKRRAAPIREMIRAYAKGVDPQRAVLEGSDLTAADVERFWNELVPMLAEARGDWSRIHERAQAIVAAFGPEGLLRSERVLERFVWLLEERAEPHHFGGQEPLLPVMSRFRHHLFLQEQVLDGRAAYEALLAEPARLVPRAERSSDASQLWVMSLMRYEQVMAQLCTFRISEVGKTSADEGAPGFFEYYEFLMQHPSPGEAFRPNVVKHPDGEFTIEGFYPPPPLLPEPTSFGGGYTSPQGGPSAPRS